MKAWASFSSARSCCMPIILAYTAYAYWVFRGKVGTEGYH